MRTVNSVSEMREIAESERRRGRLIGLVPTMGALHDGHVSLVRLARELSDVVVVSVFVNPIQFGHGEDLNKYPRSLQSDCRKCGEAGVDVVFAPSRDDMYPPGHNARVEETVLSARLCGAFRPGHFAGVATVVVKLFNIVGPDVAVFGQKDAQQARIVERVVRDLDMPVRIAVGPTVREADGLAMSSRNAYLSQRERKRAASIYEALCLARRMGRDGVTNSAEIEAAMRDCISRGQIGSDDVPVAIDYAEIVDPATLEHVERIGGSALAAVAARVGSTRLIDNMLIGGD